MSLRIVEHSTGVWSYHLTREPLGKRGLVRSLCGRGEMMPTGLRLSVWGKSDHLPSKWCKRCGELAGDAVPSGDSRK